MPNTNVKPEQLAGVGTALVTLGSILWALWKVTFGFEFPANLDDDRALKARYSWDERFSKPRVLLLVLGLPAGAGVLAYTIVGGLRKVVR